MNFPFETDAGATVLVPLALENVHFRATIGGSGLNNIILGGQAPSASLEQTIMDLLPLINDPNCVAMGNCIQFSSIAGILAGLYDVAGPTGACGSAGSLSAGLFMTADTSATPPACPAP